MSTETSIRVKPIRLLASLLGGAALFFALGAMATDKEEAKADVTVIDGDTLQIDSRIFNLAGVDAPELGQRCLIEEKEWRCGLEAALALRKLTAFGSVTCATEEKGQRVTGLCHVANKELGVVLLEQGYVVALDDATPTYKSAQGHAREAKLGLWRGAFVPPEKWRTGERLPGEITDTTFCVVKAVITDKEQKIFYIPSDEIYDSVTVDPARGERMFCSDDEAILQGWNRFPRN